MKKLSLFKSKSITGRIISVVLVMITIMALSIAVPFGVLSYRAQLKKLVALEQLLNRNYDRALKHEVETTYSLIEQVYNEYINTNGEQSEEEAKLLAANLVRGLSYGEGGYFWIDTKDGTNVVLLGLDAEGKNRYNMKDAHGNNFIQEIIKKGVDGGGYTEYWFPKKGENEALPKRSYSLYFEPFNWVVGTGNYIDDIKKHVDEERESEMSQLRNLLIVMGVVTLLVLILATLAAIIFGRSFSRPIIKLSEKTKKFSEGELDVVFTRTRKDELGTLQEALGNSVGRLRDVISEVIDGSQNVASASSQMSNTAEHLSQGASRQAASTEEISSSVEEMAANIQSNTENARVTEKTSVVTEEGINSLQKIMKVNLESMQDIRAKTNIINDIATQTNLLALNAAVEAARAGEYGKGFAVVAAEVRKLSDNTQRAATEIDELTSNSLGSVEESWQNLEELLPEIQQTVEKVREISVSSKEQDIGAGQINNAVQELVGITSQNAASSEELASGSEELARQADLLSETIKFFKMNKK